MSTLIQGATIVAMGGNTGTEPFQGDILIEGDSITKIGKDIPPSPGVEVIDARGKLVMPGLVNAHLHTGEALYKGRYDNLPLELWMLYSYPVLDAEPLGERLIYLRSMLVAMEALKTGTTCFTDDMYESPQQSMAQLGAAVQAYDDVGIRATVSGHVVNKNYLDTVPFAREHVPAALQDEIGKSAPPSTEAYLEFAKEAYTRFHDRSGRIRFMVAPSAPQRCTEDLLLGANELAQQWKVPFHTHIVETKVQGCTGPALYGRSLMRYMHDLGLLHPGVTIAHSIWVSDEDIELMGDAGVSIVHNVISNQKLGAGIAPVRKLLGAGVNVGLGTDGICSNDSANMFDVIKAAGLIHKVTTPEYGRWLNAGEVLNAGTLAGAKTARIEHLTGSIEVGKRADLLFIDMKTSAFTPCNDIRNHLVYCENGSSIEAVMVNGDIVVRDGKLTRVDEAALLEELRQLMPEFLSYHAKVERSNSRLFPYIDEIHKKCALMDIGVNRLGTDDAYGTRQ
ncbi:Amidohydrolase family protein [Aquisalimonas asiatica]|uniref:Amidohydrolase family protein n=2 Tax=Aquisalimonas asiatica TaxID=406100 RepID=A0A1H8RHK5_9GAMM|nr:Amidohydrolase family protein [Aquisalimonas asiatica]